MTLEQKIAMLRQMRYVAAQRATGGRTDQATEEMIRAHIAIQAMEAVKSEGLPEQTLNVDIDGRPLDPSHDWNQPNVPRSPEQTAADTAKIRGANATRRDGMF